jgi:hypothetical protein
MTHMSDSRLGTITRRGAVAALAAFILVPSAPAEGRVPRTPRFGKWIEPHAEYVGQRYCRPKPKPGVVAFRKLVMRTYPWTYEGNISRDCSVGGTSEHKEGRALDWGVSAASAKDRGAVDDLLDWMLRKDRFGHRHAMARRLGVMYVIWNRRMWSTWDGWEVYCVQRRGACRDNDGDVVHAHNDHVHFSFGWPGARKNTSFWNPEMSRR